MPTSSPFKKAVQDVPQQLRYLCMFWIWLSWDRISSHVITGLLMLLVGLYILHDSAVKRFCTPRPCNMCLCWTGLASNSVTPEMKSPNLSNSSSSPSVCRKHVDHNCNKENEEASKQTRCKQPEEELQRLPCSGSLKGYALSIHVFEVSHECMTITPRWIHIRSPICIVHYKSMS